MEAVSGSLIGLGKMIVSHTGVKSRTPLLEYFSQFVSTAQLL